MTDTTPDADAVEIANHFANRIPGATVPAVRAAVAALAREYEFCPPGTLAEIERMRTELADARAQLGMCNDAHDENTENERAMLAEVERLRAALPCDGRHYGLPHYGPWCPGLPDAAPAGTAADDEGVERLRHASVGLLDVVEDERADMICPPDALARLAALEAVADAARRAHHSTTDAELDDAVDAICDAVDALDAAPAGTAAEGGNTTPPTSED